MIWESASKICQFKNKIAEFIREIKQNNFISFPRLEKFLFGSSDKYTEYLTELQESFEKRFRDFEGFKAAFRFARELQNIESSDIEELANIFDVDCSQLKTEFQEMKADVEVLGVEPLSELKKKKSMSLVYSKILSIYADSYNCESSFSKVNFILCKYRSLLTQMNLKHCLRIASTEIKPDFRSLLKNCQISH